MFICLSHFNKAFTFLESINIPSTDIAFPKKSPYSTKNHIYLALYITDDPLKSTIHSLNVVHALEKRLNKLVYYL